MSSSSEPFYYSSDYSSSGEDDVSSDSDAGRGKCNRGELFGGGDEAVFNGVVGDTNGGNE